MDYEEQKRAEGLIRLYDNAFRLNSNFRSLWQETADLMFPRESNITTSLVPGSRKTEGIYDTTAIVDSKEMGDGMLSALIPTGEYFYQWNVSKDNPYGNNEKYIDWCARATDKQHRALFASNFMQQSGETMRSLVTFGTGCQYSEWSYKKLGLNFRDYDIAMYVVWLDEDGNIEGVGVKFPYTARQAYGRWGENAGKQVAKNAQDKDKQEEIFQFIHLVRPRRKRNILMRDVLNYPFESVYINEKEKKIVDEGGYIDFPYHIPRWMVTSGEVMGRGVGTEILPQVKVLNRAMQDWIEVSNKRVNPPLEALESFDGEVNTTPGWVNVVQEIPSIKAIENAALGSQVAGEKEIRMLREFIDKAFFKDVFSPISDLTGDRRTTLEIRQRIREGLKRVGQPVGRVQSEWFEPLLQRTLRLLIQHGEIPAPPPGLELLEIEYMGLMSNTLSSGQTTAFQQWVAIGQQMEETYPGTIDNVNVDGGYRRLGRTLGVHADDMNTPEQRAEIRRQRLEEYQKKQMAELAQMAAQGYSQTTGAPEPGSAAGQIMGSQ